MLKSILLIITWPCSMTLTVISETSVELVGSGSREVGSVYTLTCTVALSHRASDSSVSFLWEGPSTHQQLLTQLTVDWSPDNSL